jgi:histidine ammonia-lyase
MLIGEGDVLHEGRQLPAKQVFERYGIQPLQIRIREGLALINGTSGMTGVGLSTVIQARKLLYWSVVLSAMTNELVEAFDDHFSTELNAVKHHRGQQQVAAAIRQILDGSGMIRKREDHLYDAEKIQRDVFEDKVQEYYSLRCVTQVLGPVMDTLSQAEQVLLDEFNSVSDNPIIDAANRNVYHGGNFHGDYVALEMDKLKTAITKLSMLAERQLNYILNDKLNKKFPPFLNMGTLGLNFGIQGIQFTAVSTVAENQTLSFPASIHSIPNNNDNQDIVSMGFNAAMLAHKVVENSFQVLAIQMLAVIQGVDYLDCADRMAPWTAKVYREMRALVPVFIDDQPRYQDLARMAKHLEGSADAFEGFPAVAGTVGAETI